MAKKKDKIKFNVPVLKAWLKANAPGAYKKLSNATGYSVSSIEKLIQTGRIPRIENLRFLAEALDLPMESLILFESK